MKHDNRSKLHNIIGAFKNAAGRNASSMRVRFYTVMFAFVFLLSLTVVVIFISTGTFTAGKRNAEKFVEKELSSNYNRLTGQFGDIVLKLVSVSREISGSIEFRMAEKRMSASDIKIVPAELEKITGNELERLKLAAELVNGSGVFMILDATINPSAENAEFSKAGIYLKKSELELSESTETTWLYLRGFPKIAYKNNFQINNKWKMEFNLKDKDCVFFNQLMETSQNSVLPVSKLYYWDTENIISESDGGLICSIPLIDSDGKVFGICGIEISGKNFKSDYIADNSEYGDTICIFGTIDGNRLNADNSFSSGIGGGGNLLVSNLNGLDLYKQENGITYYGIHEEINLYQSDSPFSKQRYALSVLIPKKTIDKTVFGDYLKFTLICAAFLIIGIAVSLFFGKQYINPIISAFEAIQSGSLEDVKTNIAEIDKLIEQIKTLRSANRPLPDDFFEDFTKRIKTLTPVETNILRYQIDSVDEKDITSKMFITKNALRKHNERIYAKLNVSGKQALVLYIELIKANGQADRITRLS